jgi:hypothetical protein
MYAVSSIWTWDPSNQTAVDVLITNWLHRAESFLRSYKSPDSQEILYILWNPKARYCVHKHLPPVPILSEICPVHASPSESLKICFNIILPSMPSSSQWTILLTSSYWNPVCTFSDPVCATCTFCPILLDLIIQMIVGEVLHYVVCSTPLLPCPS